MGGKRNDIKERREVAERNHVPPSERTSLEGKLLTVRRWESEKRKSCSIPVEGFRDHVATSGSLLGVLGKWVARGWSVVQLDDEGMVPMHGMYGKLQANLEEQRTIKRAELTAFFCLLRKAVGPTMVHVDTKGLIDGRWRVEVRCIGPRAKDADLWILSWHFGGGRARQSKSLPEGNAANVPLWLVHHRRQRESR